MSWIYVIFIGFIVGLLARMIKPGDDKMGFIYTVLVGIVGSVIAAFIGRSLGIYAPEEPASFIASIIGAVILLALLKFISKKQR